MAAMAKVRLRSAVESNMSLVTCYVASLTQAAGVSRVDSSFLESTRDRPSIPRPAIKKNEPASLIFLCQT